MTSDQYFQDNPSGNRFKVDKKLIGVLAVFTVVSIIILILMVLVTNTMSSLRSFGTLHTHWTESRKAAVLNLETYILTKQPQFYNRFRKKVSILHDAGRAREEMERENTDPKYITELLAPFRLPEQEIRDMITVYERIGAFPDFSKSLQIWTESDRQLKILDSLATEIHENIRTEEVKLAKRNGWLEKIELIDEVLTNLQYELTFSMGKGSRKLASIIRWSGILIGVMLIIMLGFLSRRLLKSLDQWQNSLQMSKQKYQSLFDHNPNPVYSLTTDGKLVESNIALSEMLHLPPGEIDERALDHFIDSDDFDKVQQHFRMAAGGKSQTFETSGVNNNGERIYAKVTYLPIYINDEIVGVYGITHDINEQKRAKLLVQKQLKEKTVLLEEIHHRVKNNLAIISSLIELQKEEATGNVRTVLDDAQSRILSIAMVHEKLYKSDTLSEISVQDYVSQLIDTISTTYSTEHDEIGISVDIDDFSLDITDSVTLGLILNELINNAYKHGLDDSREGHIRVQLQERDKHVTLSVADNGKGLPPDFSLDDQQSLGMTLIQTLSAQLDATLDIEQNEWTVFKIEFNLPQ